MEGKAELALKKLGVEYCLDWVRTPCLFHLIAYNVGLHESLTTKFFLIGSILQPYAKTFHFYVYSIEYAGF